MLAFKNLRVGTKLALLIAIGVVGLAAFALYAFSVLAEVQVNGPIYEELTQDQELIADILPPPSYIIESYLLASTALHAAEDQDLDQANALLQQVAKLQTDYETRHTYWAEALSTQEQTDIRQGLIVDSYEPAQTFYGIFNNQFVPAVQAGKSEEAHNIFKESLTPAYEAHRAAIDRVVQLQQAGIAESETATQALISRDVTLLTVLGLITAALAIGLGVFVARSVIVPVGQLTQAANQIISGNLDARAVADSTDEIGTLARAFNQMTTQLRDILAGLEQRVSARTRDLVTVANVSAATATELDPQKLLQSVVDLTKASFNLYHAHIYLLNDAGDTLVLTAGAGDIGRQMVAQGRTIPLDREQSLVARAARERKGVIVNDVRAAPDFLPNPLLPNTRAELAVPMIVGDRVLGVLDVQADAVNRFSEEDSGVQTTLAAQIAVALQNSRQFEQTQNFALELKGWQDAVNAAAIVSSTNVKGEIDYVNDNFVEISKYSRDELMGHDHRIVNSSYLPKEDIRNLWVTIANGRTWHGEFRNKAKDGSFYWVDTIISPILNAQGKPVKYLGIRFDITERKELELETARRAEELSKLDAITQKIQNTTRVEEALQVAARELGHALGQRPTLVTLNSAPVKGNGQSN